MIKLKPVNMWLFTVFFFVLWKTAFWLCISHSAVSQLFLQSFLSLYCSNLWTMLPKKAQRSREIRSAACYSSSNQVSKVHVKSVTWFLWASWLSTCRCSQWHAGVGHHCEKRLRLLYSFDCCGLMTKGTTQTMNQQLTLFFIWCWLEK